MTQLTLGLAVGRGTGPELAVTFERTIECYARALNIDIGIVRSPHLYHSYQSLLREDGRVTRTAQLTREDVMHYLEFCQDCASAGIKAIFRTAINAQSLYLIRQRLRSVKVDHLRTGSVSLVLVRDQLQGFYTGDNSHQAGDVVVRTMRFSKEDLKDIVDFALVRARRYWNGAEPDRMILVYKFHLLDGAMSAWAEEFSAEHGIEITVQQPDTANRNLIADGIRGRVLMVGGNEWADIMHVMLLDRFRLGRQESRFSENVYLHPDLNGLVEYQTVHGSADDIAGRDLVNPLATMRAAAAIIETQAGRPGSAAAMDRAVETAACDGFATSDAGGAAKTSEVTDAVLRGLARELDGSATAFRDAATPVLTPEAARSGPAGRRCALIVMDFQNDFCTSQGIGAHYRGDMTRMDGPAQNICAAVEIARSQRIEVIFVQFHGDVAFQGPSWRYRDQQLGKEPKCLAGSWGADFYALSPAVGERVFQKRACFDAFLCDGFESYLAARGIEHLVLAGVYADVCVDSTARTAFQKGLFITVLADCTTGLHYRDADILRFMGRLYGAQIASHRELANLSRV